MRKVAVVLAAGLLATSFVAPASGAANNRRVTREYTMAQGMIVYESAEAHWTIGTQYQVFRPNPGERFISFSISDDAGLPVRAHIHLVDSEGDIDHPESFCDESPKPIKLGTAKKVEVGVILGTCPDGRPSVVTQGTITATFSK